MNKKGFTLIEIMATVLIISAIALLSYPVLTNVLKKNDKTSEETFKKSAVIAGKSYFNLNPDKMILDEEGYAIVSIEKLIEENMLEQPEFDITNYAIKCDKDYKCEYFKTYIEYAIGDVITLNDEDYYVIKNSSFKQDYVVALKAEPLTVDEVDNYSNGYVNIDVNGNPGQATNISGYGGVSFYRGVNCTPNGTDEIQTECKNTYDESLVKRVVDAWAEDKFQNDELKEVKLSNDSVYKARLITYSEVINNLQCTSNYCNNSPYDWSYSNQYWYWTMDAEPNYTHHMWTIDSSSGIRYCNVTSNSPVVRPVINVYKSAIK